MELEYVNINLTLLTYDYSYMYIIGWKEYHFWVAIIISLTPYRMCFTFVDSC